MYDFKFYNSDNKICIFENSEIKKDDNYANPEKQEEIKKEEHNLISKEKEWTEKLKEFKLKLESQFNLYLQKCKT